mmetsp:Transcript_61769/g.147051  ORF Transcript_61769/g.147051 Transcript_61769/m.147051 type:complete len:296 (-) Transcript_61769:138-1025(-)
MSSRTDPCFESGCPNATRESTRRQCRASARSASPINRMQWWMRPGPRRPCAISNPRPSPSSRLLAGTSTSLKRTSACPWGASSNPKTESGRTTFTPGASKGTSTIDCCRCLGALRSVFPMKMHVLQRGSMAPDVHHLRPFSLYPSPSRAIVEVMFVASDEATSGSVMAKHERAAPESSAGRNRSCCSGVPYLRMTSMFPVSGAEQLKTSDAKGTAPMISARRAYSWIVSPAPCLPSLSRSGGSQRFQSPSAFALPLSASSTGGIVHLVSGSMACCVMAASAGYTCACMNAVTFSA